MSMLYVRECCLCIYAESVMLESGQQLCLEHFLTSRSDVSEYSSQQVLLAARHEGGTYVAFYLYAVLYNSNCTKQ